MARGSLRIYLGAAPGVGKTYKMLGEGARRASRGADVVIGIVETHGRAETAAQLGDIEIMPLKEFEYRGTVLREMDLAAILERRPQIVLVDEYAHTDAPGSKNDKRWQDVEQLLDAGIDVISTVNIQHLESLNDVISRITGTVQRETVPDDVVRRADQLELVDMTPEAIRRRLAHGNIYPAERIDPALSNYFRIGNLGALRELALLWVADRVEESLQSYLEAHDISGSWETRERVVVGVTGIPGGEALIRRAARMAGRVGGDFIGVHVAVDDGLARDDADSLSAQRLLVEQLGGRVHEVVGHDPAEALAAFAKREKATQLVLGATRRSRWHELVHGSFVARVTRLAGDVDVHVIAQHEAEIETAMSAPRAAPGLDRRRIIVAWILATLGLPLLIAGTVPLRESIALSTELLVALSLVLAIAAIGGRVVAAFAAIAASLLVNWYFVVPFHTFTIAEGENIVALVVFVTVAVTVGALVDVASKRSLEARRARLEAEALARSTSSLAADPEPVPRLLEQLRETFGLDGIQIVRAGPDGLLEVASAGDVAGSPSASIPLALSGQDTKGPGSTVQLFGRTLSTDDHRLLRVLADQLAVAVENRRLMAEAAEAATLAEIDTVRTALLRAVSHDLRTPLASIKAMISGLRDPSVKWTDDQLAEALETVDQEADRLNRLVGNLLDASRLQIGALAVNCQAMDIAESIAATLGSIGPAADRIDVEIPDRLSAAFGDSALFERSLYNVMTNALHHGAAASVRLTVGVVGREIHVCTIDRGPGIDKHLRAKVMAPFQQLGDNGSADGVGLGMSIAQGFIQAMHGRLELDDTPGGGLTVIIALPLAEEGSPS